MSERTTPPDDKYVIRCPRLGHEIYFSYCRSEDHGLPCSKVLDCWFVHFDVGDYLRQELSLKEWESILSKPIESKTASLIDLIKQAKKRTEGG
ncbi:MAG: hypothetical protein AMK69_04915 [Nitrospira bacterium SG8_3]|nr:MAG: hypothetical protein AMK69_04915 [Nitrospira bacterium SG8_3]